MPVKKPQLPAEQRRKAVLTAYVTEDEYARIVESSEKACMTVSEFARRVCTGVKIESREDQKARLELLKVNADLGRLGGLLKQALAEGHSKSAVIGLLHKIDRVQAELKRRSERYENDEKRRDCELYQGICRMVGTNRLKVWVLAALMLSLLAFVEICAGNPQLSWLMGWSWLFPFWRP